MYYKTDFSIINELLEEFNKDYIHDDFNVYVFPQLWGSTALGYGGFGGQAMTSADTIVLHADYANVVRVYFGGKRLAYEIKNPNSLFFEDLFKHSLEGQYKASKYKREE